MCRVREYMLSHFNCTNSATLWTVACQPPLSIGCSRQEYWSGCHDLLQGIFLTLGLNLSLLCFLHRQMGSLSLAPPGKPPYAECIIRNARLDESQWNQDYLEKYQQPQICRWYHCNGRKRRGTKGLLDEGERGKWKACLTLNIQMTKTMASGFISSVQFSHSLVSDSLWPHGLQHARSPCHFMANRWRKNRNSDRLFFLGLQNHWGLWL